MLLELLFQFKPGVVSTQRDLHGFAFYHGTAQLT
jgi:hypothetical protein